jgi:hypothetical protein
MNHSFNVELACEVGTNAAVLLENIFFWCQKNEANGQNEHDGLYWTYNSAAALSKLFPYMSPKQIYTALDKLESSEYIKSGNYNKSAYDRTKWYAVTKKGKSIYTKCEMEITKDANGIAEKDEPIPDINTDINTDMNNKTTFFIPIHNSKNICTLLPQEAIDLADLLADLHKKNVDEGYKVKPSQLISWGHDIEKLHRLDGRKWEDIEKVIRWTQRRGCFWSSNIISGSKLKKQFPTLIVQMNDDLKKYTIRNGKDASEGYTVPDEVFSSIPEDMK